MTATMKMRSSAWVLAVCWTDTSLVVIVCLFVSKKDQRVLVYVEPLFAKAVVCWVKWANWLITQFVSRSWCHGVLGYLLVPPAEPCCTIDSRGIRGSYRYGLPLRARMAGDGAPVIIAVLMVRDIYKRCLPMLSLAWFLAEAS